MLKAGPFDGSDGLWLHVQAIASSSCSFVGRCRPHLFLHILDEFQLLIDLLSLFSYKNLAIAPFLHEICGSGDGSGFVTFARFGCGD